MSKTARAIPGQRVMSRLFNRVASRPAIGPSPTFYARFGLDDPWAGGMASGPVDSEDPFVFLSAAHYYASVERMRIGRRRLMERFKAMEQPSGVASLFEGRKSRRGTGAAFRTSHLAQLGLSSAVLLDQALPEVAPEADESAGGWVERKGRATKPKAEKVAAAARSERPLVRALRQVSAPSSALPVALRAVADAGIQLRGSAQRELRQALIGVEQLSEREQVEVTRRVVRQLRGVQRRAVEQVVEESLTTNDMAPSRVAAARMPSAPSRSRNQGLRPMMAGSPSLVSLAFEAPVQAEVAAQAPVTRKAAVAPARSTANRETPVARVAREARTQTATGRAGPEFAAVDEPVARPALRKLPTERVAARAKGIDATETSDVRRGFDAVVAPSRRPAMARVADRSVVPAVAEADAVQLSASPVRRTRANRALAGNQVFAARVEAAVEATPGVTAAPARAAKPAKVAPAAKSGVVAPSSASAQRAPVQTAAVGSFEAPAAAPMRATRRLAARAVSAAMSTESLSISPTAYVRSAQIPAVGAAPSRAVASRDVVASSAPLASNTPSIASASSASVETAPIAVRPSVIASLRAQGPVRVDRNGAPMLSPASVARVSALRTMGLDPVVLRSAPEVAQATEVSAAPAARKAAPAARAAASGARPVAVNPAAAARGVSPITRASTPAARAEAAQVAAGTVSPRRVSATERVAQRASVAPATSRAALSAAPTRYVHAAPAPAEVEVAGAVSRPAPARVAPAARVAGSAVQPSASVARSGSAAAPAAAETRRAAVVEADESAVQEVSAPSTVRALARSVAPVNAESASVTANPVAYARPETARRVSRLLAPEARVIAFEAAETEAVAPVAGAPRAAAVAKTPAARAAAAQATSPRAVETVSPSGRPVVASGRPVVASPAARSVASETSVQTSAARNPRRAARHAVRRAEMFGAPPAISEAQVVSAARSITAARAERRTLRPSMAHVADDFRLALPTPVATDAPSTQVATGQGVANGPVSRTTLGAVLRRVSSAVRAMERAEVAPLVTEGASRAFAAPEASVDAPSALRARSQRVVAGTDGRLRAARTARVDGTLLVGGQSSVEAAEVAVAPVARGANARSPMARAESRAVVAHNAQAKAQGSTPGSRVVSRAFRGATMSGAALDQVVARALSPIGERSPAAVARYRTVRTADGRYVPVAPEAFNQAASRFSLGSVDVPRRPRLDATSGLVLAQSAPVEVDAPVSAATPGRAGVAARTAASPAGAAGVRGVATAQPAYARSAAPRVAGSRAAIGRMAQADSAPVAQRARPFGDTLGYLQGSAGSAPGGNAAVTSGSAGPVARSAVRPAARRSAVDPITGTTVRAAGRAAPLDVDGYSPDENGFVPSYAARAVEGTLHATAGARPVAQRLPPRLAGGAILTALARADAPEEVVQVLLQRSSEMQSLVADLPAPAARLVERIVNLGNGQSVVSGVAGSAPTTRLLSNGLRSSSASARVRRVLPAASTPAAEGQGSSQVTRLAQKLMSLIHLAENDRKGDEAKRQVRMAENSSEARSEGSASVAAGQSKNVSAENVNISALQREVLEAVLRELSLTQMRRQEDPDVSNWW